MSNVLHADRVSFRYLHDPGLDPAVQERRVPGTASFKGVSLTVQAGDYLLITGPSGCGKSTLARCLTGLIPHLYRGELSGTVELCGMTTAETPLWQLSEYAGFVFQNAAAQLLATTVEDEILFGLENLGLSRPEMATRLEAALAHFNLEPLRRRAPRTLSGGEQQRLALAAVMARRPPLLVLDEPLSMLDVTAGQALIEHLNDLRHRPRHGHEGTAVVICEHRHEYLKALPGLRTLHLNGAVPEAGGVIAEAGAPFPTTPPFTLVVEGLGVTLGGHPILHNLSLTVPGGQILAIVGRNGVGKTTLLRAIAGLQRHEGRVRVAGRGASAARRSAPDLAVVFQNPDLQLFNPTAREEILYKLPSPDMSRYRWLLHRLGLAAYERSSPLLLSEGEKKRLALATALMAGPAHGVLLDEPSLGQDTAHKDRLMHLARAVAGAGRCVVMTTHDLALAARADRMVLLGRDGIVADGPPARVLENAAAWQRIGLAVPDWITGGPDDEPATS
jgi:energy-coupling factor transport system ATP-binding protein